ncbi:MAG TPA: glycosyltransferase family 39 protein [Anaerolineae bacterium]|jgi:hypothetical protein
MVSFIKSFIKNPPDLNSDSAAPAVTTSLEQSLAREWVVVGLLFLIALVSRLPFQSDILYHWDSVNFAYAIREFNIAQEQPQPPGYIVYVWLTQFLDGFIGDAPTTLVSLSLISSALSTVAMYYLGRSMFNRLIGLIAALLLATSPLFWFYSEIALPHTLDTLLVIVSVWWLYETMRGNHRYLLPAIVVLAVAGGVRQQTLVFLAPLLLFALRGVGWRRFFMAGLLGTLICLAWFIPLMILSDGLSNYMRVMSEFSQRFQSTTSVFSGAGWWGVRRNLIKLSLYTLYAWSVAIIPVGLYLGLSLWRRDLPKAWEKVTFLSLWIVPTVFFYALIHMGQQGLVFVFLPALLLISALSLQQLLKTSPAWFLAGAATLVALNIGIFWLAPEHPLGPTGPRLLSHATLVNSDDYYRHRFEAIKQNFPPASTAILAANWHHVEYYLPDYSVSRFTVGSKWEVNAGLPLSDSQQSLTFTLADLGLQPGLNDQANIVIFDPILADFNRTSDVTSRLPLPGGDALDYIQLGTHDQLLFEANSFGLVTQN